MRVVCSMRLHRCVVCRQIDAAQDRARCEARDVRLWCAYDAPNGWGQSSAHYQVTAVDSTPPANPPGWDAWSLVATVTQGGAVTWGDGWSP